MTGVGVGEPPSPVPSNEASKFSPLVHADLAQVVSALTNIQQREVCVWSEWRYYELDSDEVRRESRHVIRQIDSDHACSLSRRLGTHSRVPRVGQIFRLGRAPRPLTTFPARPTNAAASCQ